MRCAKCSHAFRHVQESIRWTLRNHECSTEGARSSKKLLYGSVAIACTDENRHRCDLETFQEGFLNRPAFFEDRYDAGAAKRVLIPRNTLLRSGTEIVLAVTLELAITLMSAARATPKPPAGKFNASATDHRLKTQAPQTQAQSSR
jgi:hypothetical protein